MSKLGILSILLILSLSLIIGCGGSGSGVLPSTTNNNITSQANDGTLNYTIAQSSIIPMFADLTLKTAYIQVTIVDYNTTGGSFTKTTTLSNSADWFTAKTETALPSEIPLRVEFRAIAQSGGATLSHRYEYVKIPANGSITLDAVILGATYDPNLNSVTNPSNFFPYQLYIQPKNWATPNRVLQKLVIGNSDPTAAGALVLGNAAFVIENKAVQFTPSNTLANLALEGTAGNYTKVTQFNGSYTFTPRALPLPSGNYQIDDGGGNTLDLIINTTGGTNVTVE